MKKKKIALCMRDMQLGGAENVLVRMMDAMLATGAFDITLITYVKITEPVYVAWLAAHPQVRVCTLYPSRFFGTRLPHFFLWRLVMHAMRDVYRGVRFMTMRARHFAHIDTFVDFYDFGFRREFKKFRGRKIAWWHSSINKFVSERGWRHVKKYDVFVTLTDGFVQEFSNAHPEFSSRIIRIYNPVDVQSIRGRAENGDAVAPGKRFVCVGRMAVDKDVATVLTAFDRFWCDARRPRDVRLYMIGGGPLLEHWRAVADKMPSGKNIIFTGPVSNPFVYMRGAMAHILSSYSEGLPTVLVEAAAVGTLNIASDCKNGPREILMDGAAGLLYAPGDADALAAHLQAVYRATVDVNKMTAAATRGLDRFASERIMRQIETLMTGIG